MEQEKVCGLCGREYSLKPVNRRPCSDMLQFFLMNRMFDKHYHIQDDHSRIEAARINAISQEKFAEQLRSISEAEIKSKDRVDITLEEYERLKDEVKRLTERERALMSVIEQLKIPADVLPYILPDSVRIYTCLEVDFMNELQHYRIEFAVPRECLKGD